MSRGKIVRNKPLFVHKVEIISQVAYYLDGSHRKRKDFFGSKPLKVWKRSRIEAKLTTAGDILPV